MTDLAADEAREATRPSQETVSRPVLARTSWKGVAHGRAGTGAGCWPVAGSER
jgi:hypothetical protein